MFLRLFPVMSKGFCEPIVLLLMLLLFCVLDPLDGTLGEARLIPGNPFIEVDFPGGLPDGFPPGFPGKSPGFSWLLFRGIFFLTLRARPASCEPYCAQ